jgi:hypothetical protein
MLAQVSHTATIDQVSEMTRTDYLAIARPSRLGEPMLLGRLTLISAAAALALPTLAQSSTQLTGTITDSNCGAKHGMAGMTPAQCTKACIKSGASYALVSGDKVYTLKGDKTMMDKYAGAKVTIAGDADGTTVNVKSIKPA